MMAFFALLLSFVYLVMMLVACISQVNAAGQCLRRKDEAQLTWNYDSRTGRCFTAVEMAGSANFTQARNLCASYDSTLASVPNLATNAFLISPLFLPNRREPRLLMIGLRFTHGQGRWDDNSFYSSDRFQSFSNSSLQQSNKNVPVDRLLDDLCTIIIFDQTTSAAAENGKWGRVGCSMPLPKPVAVCSRLADESDVCPPGSRVVRIENARRIKCEPCPINTFQPLFNQESCRECPGPAMQGYFIDTQWPGATSQVQCYRPLPSLIDFQPKLGIYAGGTVIRVHGQNFFVGSDFIVLFNDQPGELLDSSSDSLTIKTPPLNTSDPTVYQTLPNSTDVVATFQLLFNNDIFIVEYFTYRANPVVHGYSTGSFIAGGGQNITVYGDNLDASNDITLLVEVANATDPDQQEDDGNGLNYFDSHSKSPKVEQPIQIRANCVPYNSSLMTCQLPDFYSLLPGITRRQISGASSATTPLPVSSGIIAARQNQLNQLKRPRGNQRAAGERDDGCTPALLSGSSAADSAQLQPQWRTTFSFAFDQAYTIKPTSEAAMSSSGEVVIYDDPTFDKWPSDQVVVAGQVNETVVKIQGRGLLCGLTEQDYKVTIGQQRLCDITEINMTTISCHPRLEPVSRSAVRLPVLIRVGAKAPFNVGNLIRFADKTTTTTESTTTTTTRIISATSSGATLGSEASTKTTSSRKPITSSSPAAKTTTTQRGIDRSTASISGRTRTTPDTIKTTATNEDYYDYSEDGEKVTEKTTIRTRRPLPVRGSTTTKRSVLNASNTTADLVNSTTIAPRNMSYSNATTSKSGNATTTRPTTTIGRTTKPLPTTTTTPAGNQMFTFDPWFDEDTQQSSRKAILIGVIVGVGVAVILVLTTIIVVCILWRRRQKNRKNKQNSGNEIIEATGSQSSRKMSFNSTPPPAAPSTVLLRPVPNNNQVPLTDLLGTMRKSLVPRRSERGSIHNEGLSQHGSMIMHDGFIVIKPNLINSDNKEADEEENELSLREARQTFAELPEALRVKVMPLLVAHGRIKIASTFLRGHFGELAFGYWAPTLDRLVDTEAVMVKSLNRFMQRGHVVRKFLADSLLLQGCSENVNCLAPVAVAFRRSRPLVLYPHFDGVNLKIYLTDDAVTVLVRQLVDIASQVASAMVYLSQAKNVIHKDIAARNCILAPDNNYLLKLTDNALVGDMHGLDYEYIDEAHDFLPVRWAAPETLLRLEYSVKTDVWSFGVFIWEIFTRCGAKPFADIHSVDIVTELRQRARDWLGRASSNSSSDEKHEPIFSKPNDDIPDEVNDIINECCQPRPQLRPNFPLLNDRLTVLLDERETFADFNKPIISPQLNRPQLQFPDDDDD